MRNIRDDIEKVEKLIKKVIDKSSYMKSVDDFALKYAKLKTLQEDYQMLKLQNQCM